MSFNPHSSPVKNCGGLLAESSLPRFTIAVLLACFLSPGLSAEGQLKFTPRDQGSESKSEGSGSKADGSSSSNGSGNRADGSANRNGPASGDRNAEMLSAPPEKLFRLMLARIRENEAAVNRLYSTMPLGFADRQKKQLALIDALSGETSRLKAALPAAAIESFKANPGHDPAATQFVIRTLNELIEPTLPDSVFGPKTALEIIDAMMDAGADKDVILLSKGFRASFAIDDFDRAALMLDRIREVKPGFDLGQTRQLVEDSAKKWQRELAIRRLERNNDNLPKIKFETTAGDFIVALYEDHAPNTVANFVSLVEKKFYNDLVFHYVKPGEYIHTGSPNGNGTGGPGYTIPSEFNREQTRTFFSGTLGMANTGPNTEGSQFVITHQPLPQLDGNFTAFGRVIEGFDVLLNCKAIDPKNPVPADGGVAREPVRINKATVLRKRDHEYKPEKFKQQDVPGMMDDLDGPPTRSDDLFAPRSASQDVPPIDGGSLFSPSNP